MSDVLSQAEIDALLAAMLSGEAIQEAPANDSTNENDVPSTVLKNSLKFADKDIEILEFIHKEYAKIITTDMFNGSNIKLSLESIQEIRYEEFKRSLPCPTDLTIFKLRPLDGHLLFETSPDLVFQLENIFKGGSGDNRKNIDAFSEENKTSSIEISSKFIKNLEKAWDRVLDVKAEVQYLETDPSKIDLFKDNESVALISFSISIEKVSTLINICIPYSSIEKYSGKLKIKSPVRVASPKIEFSNSGLSGHNFDNAVLNLKVILGDIELPLSELMNLQKGTTLNTNIRYTNKAKILVEEKHCFNGEIGLRGNRKAVRILDNLEKGVKK